MEILQNLRRPRIVLASALVSATLISSVPSIQMASANTVRPTTLSVLKQSVELGPQRLVNNHAVLNGKTYFSGKTSASGAELWVTDGTDAGTVMLKDIRTGSTGSNPNFFYTLGNKVIFVADDGTHGAELWVTDGTSNGTVLLKDIAVGATSSLPGSRELVTSGSSMRGDGMSIVNGKLYFAATTTAEGREPWVTDGTPNGTQIVSDIRPGASGSMDATASGPFLPAGGKVVFSANSGTNGDEPMVYDGTTTSLLKDVYPGNQGSGFTVSTLVVGDSLYFSGYNGNKYSIWKTDGTTAGTVDVIDIAPNSMALLGNRILIFGTQVVHQTPQQGQYDDPARLWVSDGTQVGTSLLSRINPTNYPEINFLKQVGSHYIFSADDGTNGGELWTTDGTVAGTQLLIDAFPGSTGTFSGAMAFNDSFMMTNPQNTFGFALLRTGGAFHSPEIKGLVTDGTPAGTSILPGDPFSRVRSLMPAGNHFATWAEWGMSMTNGLIITAPGSNSQLTQLGVSGRKVPMSFPPSQPVFGAPSFNSSTTAYSINLTGGANTVDIGPRVTTGPGAPSCTIEGVLCSAGQSGTHSFTITAPRLIEVVVTAGNGTTTTYTISVSLNGVAPVATTTTTAPATPTAVVTPSAGATPSVGTNPSSVKVTPGVTVTDTKVYSSAAPKRVASGSAISVLTPAQAKTQTIQTLTPAVCVPTADDIVFIDEGRCNATVLSKRTGEVLRRIRTTVIEEDVVKLGVGNEIVTLAPIFFQNGKSTLTNRARARVASLKDQISAAGTVMVIGHSGMMLGNTPENQALARSRAINTVREMKRIRATGPFYSTGVGALDPAVPSSDRSKQALNRRVVIVLIP